jgi:hypothetical protein
MSPFARSCGADVSTDRSPSRSARSSNARARPRPPSGNPDSCIAALGAGRNVTRTSRFRASA